MIEMAIIAMIVSSVTLRVAGNVAVDGFFAARGLESPRYTRAKARRTPGAASRYWSEVWDDAWTNASKKRADKKAGLSSTPRPRGAATQFLAGLFQDGRRTAGRRWEDGWVRLDERRRERATRPRPGQVTVPGTVVPNAPSRPEDEDRPEDRPRPEPTAVPDEDDSPVPVPQDEHTDPTDPGQQDEDPSVPDYPPDSGPDNQTSSPLASTTTQEGTTVMTAVTAEVFSLDTALAWCDQSTQQYRAQVASSDADAAYCRKLAQAFREQAIATDFSLGSIRGAGVTGAILASIAAAQEKADAAAKDMEQAEAAFRAAQEKSEGAAADMEAAATEFRAFKPGQEFYDSRPDAPDREFLTAGR